MDFTHLHLHTEFSLLDGAIKIDELVEKAKQFNMKSIAITDHGNLFGAVDFYKACKKRNIKPLIGSEIYVSMGDYRVKDPNEKEYYHLILLAKNEKGLKNLFKISSESYINGFYYKPRISKEYLKEHAEGLVALSACLSGEIQKLYLRGDLNGAMKALDFYQETFGDDFYLEVQNHGITEERAVIKFFKNLSETRNIKCVATNDCHYLNKEDAIIQEILMAISTGKTLNDSTRMRFDSDEFYFKSQEEMAELFKDFPEAIANTQEVVEKCNVEFEFGNYHLPSFTTPNNQDHYEYLKAKTYEGLQERYVKNGELPREVIDRVEHELKIIKDMGFVDYFLIVQDFILFAKEKEIPVGPGRGSSVGSVVCYALGIVDMDPLKYDLFFERFLNPERVTMPDIDIDFGYERRGEVIDYVREKYGESHVAQIITFGTMAAKGAVRDVGRVLNLNYNFVDKIAKMIPFALDMTIDKALETNNELKKFYDTNDDVKRLIDLSKRIEGHVRHISTHAAGVVISKDELVEYAPLAVTQDMVITQFPMTTLEELGLLKMDFLGLRTLTVIDDTLKSIEANYGRTISFKDMSLDDKKTIQLFRDVNTIGIFQFESPGMRNFLKELKVERFEDLVAANSLFRPGPMNSIPDFCRRKNSGETIDYGHPILKDILEDTYGVIVFQEQVISIVEKVGGYSLGRADNIRRAMSKKKMDVMEAERPVFINGAVNKGFSKELANDIYNRMIDFAKYAFNKSHSAAYSLDAWRTAWLKAHYGKEFMAALLTSVAGSQDKVSLYIEETKRMGIEILQPNINMSEWDFKTENDGIRFGLKAVKGLGINTVNAIMKAREKGSFKNLEEVFERVYFVDKTALNKRSIEALIYAGAFDALGISRREAVNQYELIIDSILLNKRHNVEGQINLFGEIKEVVEETKPVYEEFSNDELLEFEHDVLGVYISSHPLKGYEQSIKASANIDVKEIDEQYEEFLSNGINMPLSSVRLAGFIKDYRFTMTKNKDKMAIIQFEDLTGGIELVVFPRQFVKLSEFIKSGEKIIVSGSINYSDVREPSLIVDNIYKLSNYSRCYIKIKSGETQNLISKAKKLIRDNPGFVEVVFYFEETGKRGVFSDAKSVSIYEHIKAELIELLGEENIVLE